MKKSLLILSIALYGSLQTIAQEQGPVSVSVEGALGPIGTRSTGNSLGFTVAYHSNRFSIGTGLTYFNSGREQENRVTFPLNTYPPVDYEEYVFRHLLVPLTLSYHAPMGRKVEFIPSIGFGISYNTSAKYRTQSSDSNFYKRDFNSAEFDRYFRKVSVWGHAAVRFSYKLSEAFALLAGVEARGMLTGLYKPEAHLPQEHPLALYFSLGARYRF